MSQEFILRSERDQEQTPYKTVGEYAWTLLNELNDESICLIDANTDERLTIGSLKSQANSIAVALIKRGITKTDRIAFSGSNSIEHTVLRFATFFLGNTFMPLSPTFEKYEVQQEVESAQVNVIFSSTKDLNKFSGILKDSNNNSVKLVVVFDGQHNSYPFFQKLLEEGKDKCLDQIPYFDINPDKDMFFLIHTSGSSGKPKCAMIPHRSVILSMNNMKYFSGGRRGTIVGMMYPFGHMSGTTSCPINVLFGSTVILFSDFDEEVLMKSIEKYRINVLPVFPNIGRKFIEGNLADKYDLTSLQMISTAGASFPGNIAKALIDKYGVKFTEGYGMTESFIVSVNSDNEFIPGNVGKVVPGTEVKIVDLISGQSLGPNIDGEICLRSNKLFAGYLNDEKATREAFDSQGWYRTGDIGHYDEKERLFITDRVKEVVRIAVDNHYINISPVEIEQFLLTHKSIAEVAVVGVNNKRGTHWPRAYVVPKEGQTVTAEEIEKFVSKTLAYTKQLKGGVVFVDSIHRTSIGKVDRKFYRNLVKEEIIEY